MTVNHTQRWLRNGALAFGLAALTALPAAADTLDDIIANGKLVAGVKTDYAPWGMRDANGEIVGMEIDMINDFAKRIGEQAGKEIEVELVPVVASNRMQFLEQGRIDVMIATMNDLPERRKIIGIVQPDYYSSGVAILAREGSGIDGWDSLEGKKICAIQGSWYVKDYGLKNGADMVVFPGVPEVESAILEGRCDGWLYDDSAFVPRKVNEPEKWADYEIATPVVADAPWGAAVRLDDRDAPLGKALSAAIIDWHTSGYLVELESKWNIPATAWLAKMHEACLAGEPICDDVLDEGE
ncbi:transporter substrate-binding domain-containing protein [Amaricoccus solimangrovi]|uniref:Transporter substrate-binding domain-containing protein n=1 Tax=Amaricoccus solimangrovi TaxID=2589815 RepID=A0A501WS00_9RHOB|nr:transporter substrate-binding domain-containing protein [Amaricoccus solimangrovi]TPE51612.1 transporter substrate-binding domain-containing protein [Amaricoccus solimangrovi]